MFEQNIIDPLKVTRTALLNAVAVAKTILSTKAIVLNEYQWKEKIEELYKFNRHQTVLNEELKDSLPKEVWLEFNRLYYLV
jgi:hypothetical protein